MYNIRRLKEII